MRGLLLLVAVLVVVWLWQSRAKTAQPGRRAQPPEPQLQDMVRCQQCGVHLPLADAVSGHHGSYCCAEHLHLSEP